MSQEPKRKSGWKTIRHDLLELHAGRPLAEFVEHLKGLDGPGVRVNVSGGYDYADIILEEWFEESDEDFADRYDAWVEKEKKKLERRIERDKKRLEAMND